jgi:hypothetical protein
MARFVFVGIITDEANTLLLLALGVLLALNSLLGWVLRMVGDREVRGDRLSRFRGRGHCAGDPQGLNDPYRVKRSQRLKTRYK